MIAPSDSICQNINYKLFVCAGVVPTIENLKLDKDSAFCKQRYLLFAGKTKLEFDTSNDSVAAGVMYVALVPDFS